MNTENISLMRAARESLKGKWGLAILTFFIYTLLTATSGSVRSNGSMLTLSSILTLIIGGPLALGAAIFSLSISRGKEATLEQIFQGFNNFSNFNRHFKYIARRTPLNHRKYYQEIRGMRMKLSEG